MKTLLVPIIDGTEDALITELDVNPRIKAIFRQNKIITVGDFIKAIETGKDAKWRQYGYTSRKKARSALIEFMFDMAPDPDAYAKRLIELNWEAQDILLKEKEDTNVA